MMQAVFGFPRFRVVKDKLTGLYKCHLCSYKSVYGSSLRSHFAVHSNARPYGCDMCSYEAKRLPDLKKHKILKHLRKNHSGVSGLSNKNPLQVFRDPGSGLYRCQHCSYQSDNARCVRSHLAVHSHLRPYACDTCSYEAKRSSDLSKHKIIKHGRIPLRRNKSRKAATGKTDTVHSTNDDVSEGAQTAIMTGASTSCKPDPQHVQQDLDRCDVLSDLDYSLMSPTRVALEALRRCNMMEPLEMFNEYSNHEGYQQNAVFPEPEMSNYNNRQFHNDEAHLTDENRTNNINYNTTHAPGVCAQGQNDNPDIVFVKPEPPDDYFDHMRCQNNHIVKVNPLEENISRSRPSPNNRSSHELTSRLDGTDGGNKMYGGPDHGREPRETTGHQLVDMDQPKSTQSMGSDLQSNEKVFIHLERRNVSGSSLIRPVMPNPRPPPEFDRASVECSQSRESGYSSPGISAPVIQSLGLTVEHSENTTKTTNTRKSWSCQHCDIMFFDGALYFMHMGLHNSDDPWRCNMCCTKFFDVYGFTSHFVNGH